MPPTNGKMSPANTLAKASTLLAVLLVLGLANNVNSKLNGDHALNDGMCNLLLKTTQDLEDARGKYISTKSQIVDDNNNPSARRMMLEANATTKTNAQKIASRVSCDLAHSGLAEVYHHQQSSAHKGTSIQLLHC